MSHDQPGCSPSLNKQTVSRCIKICVSRSPTDVWEPLRKCDSGLRSVPWTWSASVCEVRRRLPGTSFPKRGPGACRRGDFPTYDTRDDLGSGRVTRTSSSVPPTHDEVRTVQMMPVLRSLAADPDLEGVREAEITPRR